MDRIDEQILNLIKGNARMSYQEIGDAIGMSRVAAMKRVRKLEESGIIRGYNTRIYKDGDITMLIDIETKPDKFEEVLKYVSTRTAWVREIYTTTKPNSIHMVAVSDSAGDLKYLAKMIRKKCGDDVVHIDVHAVREVIKDVYGGIRHEDRSVSQCNDDNGSG
jgi:DNA-binding Lrp family transcriptional regulator